MAVIWTILELIFLFFFFELPLVDDMVKSKYEEHLEHSHQQQPQDASDKQSEVDAKHCTVNSSDIEEQSSNCDPLVSISKQEQTPLLTDATMKDMPTTGSHRNATLPPLSLIQRIYWLLNG